MAKAPEPNLNSVTDQIKEMVEKFKLPGVDAQALVEQQRNNINAAVETMRIAADGTHSVSKRQLELFHAASTQLLSMFSEAKLKPEERAELAKKAFDAALAGSRELYDITAKASEEAFAVARQRVTEGVEQFRKHIERKDG
jgi:phasin family protein